MKDFYAIGILISALLNTYFGALVYLKNRKALLNKLYGLLCLAFTIWSYSWFVLLLLKNRYFYSLFLARLLNFGAIFIPIFYFHWVCVFLGEEKRKKKLILFGYFASLIFSMICWTPFYIKGTHSILFFPHWPTAGSFYIWYLIFGYFLFVVYGLFLLSIHFIKSKDVRKNQIKYVILGSLMGFLPGAINFPLMYNIVPFGRFIIPLMFFLLGIFIPFPAPLSYAVIEYRLMDIQIILTEILVGVIGILLLIQIFAAPTFWWKIVNGIIFILFCVFGYLLIRGVFREIRRREELEKISRAKTEFISITSHQLRTPLSAIKGYLSMVLEGSYGEVSDRVKKVLEKVYQSNERMIKLVNSFLDVSKIELGREELKLEEVSIENLISETISEIEIEAKKKNLYLNFDRPKVPLPKIFIDKGKIKEVLMNILDNAIRYTQEGGITVKLKTQNSKLKIIISDTGEGLTKEEISKLFESFSRGTAGTKFWTEGVGLGLYLARKFVEMHKGKIWAESEGKGKGSTFYIELPIK